VFVISLSCGVEKEERERGTCALCHCARLNSFDLMPKTVKRIKKPKARTNKTQSHHCWNSTCTPHTLLHHLCLLVQRRTIVTSG